MNEGPSRAANLPIYGYQRAACCTSYRHNNMNPPVPQSRPIKHNISALLVHAAEEQAGHGVLVPLPAGKRWLIGVSLQLQNHHHGSTRRGSGMAGNVELDCISYQCFQQETWRGQASSQLSPCDPRKTQNPCEGHDEWDWSMCTSICTHLARYTCAYHMTTRMKDHWRSRKKNDTPWFTR